MWKTKQKEIEKDKVIQFKILEGEKELTVEEISNYWINSSEFRIFYNSILKDSDYQSYFWEHPSITMKDLQKPYEFVLVKSDLLNRIKPEIKAFQQYFTKDKRVATFFNLGKDAELIVPTPEDEMEFYTHISKFVRNASEDQINDFWKEVGTSYKNSIGQSKKWLSTAGLGVYWLHVRIDTRPKYYRYSPYKE